jgi:hypothetical protein
MFKRYRSNYSLWPEQARPRRAIPLTLAAGGFAIGIVCSIAAYNVVTDFLRPAATQEAAREIAVAHVPVYATTTAPATASEPEPVSRSRSRSSVAKMTLPSIGTRAAAPSLATDGRGGGADGRDGGTDGRVGDALAGGTPVAALTPPPATPPSTPIEDPKPADEPSAKANTPKAKHTATREHPTRTHKIVQKKRERPNNYASGYRNTPFFGFRGHASYGGYGGGGYGQAYAGQQY